MKKIIFLLSLLLAQTSFAAAPAKSKPKTEESWYYRGLYVAGLVGGTLLDESFTQSFIGVRPTGFVPDLPSQSDLEAGNPAGMIACGFSYALDSHLVFGLEATAGLTHNEVSDWSGYLDGSSRVTGTVSSVLTSDFSVLFKVGYQIYERTHFYGLVGTRWANIESTLKTNVNDQLIFSKSFTGYQLGNTGGVGIEHMITEDLSLGLEYLYTNYGDYGPLDNIYGPTNSVDFTTNTNTIGARLSYHFSFLKP